MITKIEALFGLQKTKSNSNQLKLEWKCNVYLDIKGEGASD